MDDAMMERDDLITVPTLTYKPPNANDYPQPPSWQHALSAILTHVETDASSPIVLFMNENYVCIYDKYPKAKHHCLLMPRLGMLKVSSINELTPHHLDELKRFHALARNIVHELQTSISNAGDHPIPEFKLGYHAIPSLTPLHLHIISTDFDSSCMKTKHHINSFTSKFFVTAEALEAHLESAFVSFNCNKALFADVRKNMAENLLDDGMKCTKCNRTALNLPDWKRHNQSCQVDTKKTKFDCAVNVLLGWSSREFYGPNPNFAHQLSKTAFTIFNPLQDLGYYTINPKQDTYNSLSNIKSAQEILCYIDTNGTPDRLQSITGKEEVAFENPIQTALENRFPYGQMEVAGLHVAALRKVEVQNLDFVFGGSILEMLATRNTNNQPFIATLVPGTKCIMIANRKQYAKNLAQLGFQFERFVTGKSMGDTSDTSSTDHIQTMQIGNMTVLFVAEVDAADEDSFPVEIKISSPVNWGLRTVFQMISNGSTKLCHGERNGWSATNIALKSLSDVAEYSLKHSIFDVSALQTNILDGMNMIASKVKGSGLYKVIFDGKTMKLVYESNELQYALLPSDYVVERLIKLDTSNHSHSLHRKRRSSEI